MNIPNLTINHLSHFAKATKQLKTKADTPCQKVNKGNTEQGLCDTYVMCMKVTQSCLTLCDPMAYTVHGILQVRILEWVAFPFSKGSSQPRDWTQVSHIAGEFFTSWVTREAQYIYVHIWFIIFLSKLKQFSLHPNYS